MRVRVRISAAHVARRSQIAGHAPGPYANYREGARSSLQDPAPDVDFCAFMTYLESLVSLRVWSWSVEGLLGHPPASHST